MPLPCCLLSRQSPSYLNPPSNIKPQKDPRPTTRKTPSVPAPPPRSRMPSHNPRHAPTPPALCPLLRRRARVTPRHHTRPHTLSSLTGTHTPPPAAPASPARRFVLCRGLLLPRPCHPRRTHLPPSAQVSMPLPSFLPSRQSPSYLPPPRNIEPHRTPVQAPANPRQSPPRLHARASPHTTPASRQHHLPSPL
jgi:hypothetical protein